MLTGGGERIEGGDAACDHVGDALGIELADFALVALGVELGKHAAEFFSHARDSRRIGGGRRGDVQGLAEVAQEPQRRPAHEIGGRGEHAGLGLCCDLVVEPLDRRPYLA